MSELKKLTDQDNYIYALASVPDSYMTGASLVNQMQHETVPFTVTAHAIDSSRNIMIFGLTDEMFTTYVNPMIKMTLKSVPNIIWNSIRDFIEPGVYLKQFAEAISQMALTAVSNTKLPSILGRDPQKSYNDMMAVYNAYFQREASLGTPTFANNSIFLPLLVKYKGISKSGVPCVVLAGMDYKGCEYYSNVSALSAISPIGGLLGSLFKTNQQEAGSARFGHGKPCDAIDWGAANKFALICPEEYEQEATKDFIEFVSTFRMDPNLRQQFDQKVIERSNMMANQAMQYQAMAQQSRINLQRSQQQMQQTLAQNSADMSNMIMDSWNQKMASDNRISQARSEAVMGVNTYQNSYGQNYQVDVVADHVYENQYGEVYGVSGSAPDQSVLNDLNWKEIDK